MEKRIVSLTIAMIYTRMTSLCTCMRKIIGKARYSKRSQSKARVIDSDDGADEGFSATTKRCNLPLGFYPTYRITELFRRIFTPSIRFHARDSNCRMKKGIARLIKSKMELEPALVLATEHVYD